MFPLIKDYSCWPCHHKVFDGYIIYVHFFKRDADFRSFNFIRSGSQQNPSFLLTGSLFKSTSRTRTHLLSLSVQWMLFSSYIRRNSIRQFTSLAVVSVHLARWMVRIVNGLSGIGQTDSNGMIPWTLKKQVSSVTLIEMLFLNGFADRRAYCFI